MAAIPFLFLVLGLPIGLLFAVLLPPIQAPDEVAHFYRSYSVSTGVCVPLADQIIPSTLHDLQDAYPPRMDGKGLSVRFEDYQRLAQTTWRNGQDVHLRNVAANAYTCIPYLASAIGMELAKRSSQSALVLMYSARMMNLLVYLLLVYAALRIQPVGRLALFCLALMPMTLQQAASISADSLTLATSFLFIAYVTFLAFDARIEAVNRPQLVVLLVLLLVTALCKFNAWFILMALLIPPKKLGGNGKKIALVCSMFALFLLALICWQSINHANFVKLNEAQLVRQINASTNLEYIANNPFEFVLICFRTVRSYGLAYAREFVGRMGWTSIWLPGWLPPVYWATLFLAASAKGQAPLRRIDRTVCGAVFFGSFVSTFVVLWILEMAQSHFQYLATHRAVIEGVQGRYFIPFAPALFLLVSNTRLRLNPRILVATCLAVVLTAASVALVVVYRTFYLTKPPALGAALVLDAMVPETVMRATTGPLHDGDSFVQGFVAHADYLSSVELEIATYAKTVPSGWITIRLLDRATHRALASERILLPRVQDNSFVALNFPPIADSRNKAYLISLEPAQVPAGYAITMWLSDHDVYPDGECLLNGRSLQADTCFRTFVSPPRALPAPAQLR